MSSGQVRFLTREGGEQRARSTAGRGCVRSRFPCVFPSPKAGGEEDGSEGEDDLEDDEEEEVGVMDVHEADDDSEDDGDDELMQRIKQQQKQLRERRLKRTPDEWEESNEAENHSDGDISYSHWGGKKALYYGGDEGGIEPGDTEEGDQDAEREEEEEAIRLQRESAKRLKYEHFAPRWDLHGSADKDGDQLDDNAMVSLADDEAGDETISQQVQARDLSTMTEDEKAAALQEEAPELDGLLADLQSSMDDVSNTIEPTLEKVQRKDIATSGGVSYLEAKHLLLLSYCQAIAFYVLLKAEGRDVTNHPVMERLVEMKAFLKKAKPIDQKMQHQIDKAITYANKQEEQTHHASTRRNVKDHIGEVNGHGGDNDEDNNDDSGDDKDDDEDDDDDDDAGLLAYQPRPHTLVPKQMLHRQEREDGSADEKVERRTEREVYRPPKLNPAAMPSSRSDAADADEGDEEGLKRRTSRSKTMRELAQEIGDLPEEEGARGPDEQTEEQRRESEKLAERMREEEEHFTRVPLSKDEKKKVRSSRRKVGMTSQLNDFGDDVSELVKMAKKQEAPQQSVASIASQAAKGSKKSKGLKSGEADVPNKGDLGEQRAKFDAATARRDAKKRARGDAEHDESEGFFADGLDEDELYKQAQEETARKKARKSTVKRGNVPAEEASAGDGERRNITHEMRSNKGLTPHRKKEDKNPRKRLRSKHRKALVKRRGQVPAQKAGSATAYGGEESGIKKKTSKSRRIAA